MATQAALPDKWAHLSWDVFRLVVLRAMFLSTDALMLRQPCICGEPHQPATDCYMAAAEAALQAERA